MTTKRQTHLTVIIACYQQHVRLSDVSIICRVVAENLVRFLACTECTGQRNDYELIPIVKIETRNPIKGYFGSEFPAICNHCEVMAA